MNTLSNLPLSWTTPIAAVDLGSSSFRMVIAEAKLNQACANLPLYSLGADHIRLYTMDSLREPVQLGAGLQADGRLSSKAQALALQALRRFGKRIKGFAPECVAAVATHAVRVATNRAEFIELAQEALGFPIQIIEAEDEARLIYFGVANLMPSRSERRLVVDIGGGSTELIVGENFTIHAMESFALGAVSTAQTFFPKGLVDAASMQQAIKAARSTLTALHAKGMTHGWHQAVGSSGTARTLARLCVANGFNEHGLSTQGLALVRKHVIEAGNLDNIKLKGLKANRLAMLLGGIAIMSAVFEELNLEHMAITQGALRHGLLYGLLNHNGLP